VAYNAVNLKCTERPAQPSNRLTAASCPWRVAFAALLAMLFLLSFQKNHLIPPKLFSAYSKGDRNGEIKDARQDINPISIRILIITEKE